MNQAPSRVRERGPVDPRLTADPVRGSTHRHGRLDTPPMRPTVGPFAGCWKGCRIPTLLLHRCPIDPV